MMSESIRAIYTEKHITDLYDELHRMEIKLDDDPLEFGPQRLNSQISRTRNFRTRCQQLLLQVSRDLHLVQREHQIVKAQFDLERSYLLANDSSIRTKGSSIADREAMVLQKLSSVVTKLDDLRLCLTDLESIHRIISKKVDDLKDIQSRINSQIKVCEMDLATGRRFHLRSTPQELNDQSLLDEALSALPIEGSEVEASHGKSPHLDEVEEFFRTNQ